MNRAYIVENYEVIDKHKYIPPVKTINEILKKFNGKFLIATPKSETLSGTPLEVIIVIEFSSVENAKVFYHSQEYETYKKLYERTTQGWVSLSPEFIKK